MEQITIKVKQKLGCEDLRLPAYMSDCASGMDLLAANSREVALAPGEVKLIPTGIYVSIPPGYEAQIRPRSGLALKYGITVLNAPGTIDADYRGEVAVILVNLGSAPFVVVRGMRIAQMVIQKVVRAELRVEEHLEDTDRGAGGFGHTGA